MRKLRFVAEEDAPGVTAFRQTSIQLLGDRNARELTMRIIQSCDEKRGWLFPDNFSFDVSVSSQVTLSIPYTLGLFGSGLRLLGFSFLKHV